MLFSFYHNNFVVVSEIFNNNSFKVYLILDFNSILPDKYNNYKVSSLEDLTLDVANPLYFNQLGLSLISYKIDFLINDFLIKNKEFVLLNNFIFNTTDSFVFKSLSFPHEVKEQFLNLIESEYNFDLSYFFISILNNSFSEKTEALDSLELLIKNFILDHFISILCINKPIAINLFSLICKFFTVDRRLDSENLIPELLYNRHMLFIDILKIILK